MPRFNLIHFLPAARGGHGLNGYYEIIETIFWGLKKLGHKVTYTTDIHQFPSDATNIVFGAQAMEFQHLKTLPQNTVIYNFEQVRGLSLDTLKPHFKYSADHFTVWDYSLANLETWNALNAKNVQIIPIGYAPILSRIPNEKNQDIDVLLYGLPVGNRLDIFRNLCLAGLTAVFVCGIYGPARDKLIARSKIVLNIQSSERSKIFEFARVSYLWANKKAVIADQQQDSFIEEDIRPCIKFSPLDSVVEDCLTLVENYPMRLMLEESGFNAICKRDIRDILRPVVGENKKSTLERWFS